MTPTVASLVLGIVTSQIVYSQNIGCEDIEEKLLELFQTDCGQEILAQQCNQEGGDDNQVETTDEPFVGTYYPNWFVYSKHYMGVTKIGTVNEKANPNECDPIYTVWPSDNLNIISNINTLFYAFLDLNENCFITDNDPSASWYGGNSGQQPTWINLELHPNACKGVVNDMLGLKVKYPHLKLMLSVGGWTYSKNFSSCTKGGDVSFKKMYDSFNYYTGGDFGKDTSKWAGVDFDWEHPGALGLTTYFDASVDWRNYAKLVNYFRSRAESEGRNKFFITSAVGVGDTLDLLLEDSAAAKIFCSSVNHINLMTYDMHGKWENVTGHNAPFCQIDTEGNVRPVVRPLAWSVIDRVSAISDLCGPGKVALGIPNYSPAWTDIPNINNGLYQTSTASTTNVVNWATWSTFSDSDSSLIPQGIVHYWDLKSSLDSNGFQIYTKICPTAKDVNVPVKWVYSESKKAFATYEDIETVKAKTQWARKMGLAGFFFWDMSQDKSGEILNAARSGWGMTKTYPASGTKQCFDNSAPDFSKNPDGSTNVYEGCHKGTYTETVQPGDGCANIKTRALIRCNGKSVIAVGGYHQNSVNVCVNVCSPRWDNGELWASDIVYFVCDGEDVQDFDSSSSGNNNNGNNNQSGGASCFSHTGWSGNEPCAECRAPIGNQCSSTSYTTCYTSMELCQRGSA